MTDRRWLDSVLLHLMQTDLSHWKTLSRTIRPVPSSAESPAENEWSYLAVLSIVAICA